MAIITKIEEQKNKKRVNVFVDDAFFCGLNKETAVVFRLKVDKEIDESVLKAAIFESEVKSAFEKGLDYIASRMHSKKELFEKLLKKGFEKEVIEKAIEKMQEYHYVDDFLFAKQFIEQNKKLSKKMIENKLKQKGVLSEIINDLQSNCDEQQEIELCIGYVQKYVKSKDMQKDGAKQKLYASLARKGFSFDVIKKACSAANCLNYEDNDFLD